MLIPLTTAQHSLQVTFEGIAGSSFTGDIAIDSVEINSGSCLGKKKMYIFSLRPVSFVLGK